MISANSISSLVPRKFELFAMMMRVHHQSAITMAEAELKNGKDPQMRVMAKDIIDAQKKEIAAFDKFLAKRGESGMKMGK